MTASKRSVAVIGGGPAGLMAAEVLIEAGLGVTVYDGHRSMGRKLLLAGRSGLNLTHSEPLEKLLGRYEPRPVQLDRAVRAFGPVQLRAWAEGLGERTFVGSSGRVFPASLRAAPLLRAWLRRLSAAGVSFRGGHRWIGWADDGGLRFETDSDEIVVSSDASVVACGGGSWPRVGGDGRWVSVLADRGVDVKPLAPANCGLVVGWTDVFLDRFEGRPVKNVIVIAAGRRHRGEMVITRTGLEGGPVYAAASHVRREIAATGGAEIELDLAPDTTATRLNQRLTARRPKDSQTTWLRRAGVAPIAVGLLREATANALPDDPAAMAMLLRGVPVEVQAVMPLDKAISTAGGVTFDAVDQHFMLRDMAGTFVAGEMLDWDAPTGGYLLQACFSTGAAAARGAIGWLSTG